MTGNIERENPMRKTLSCATLFLFILITAEAQPGAVSSENFFFSCLLSILKRSPKREPGMR